MGDSHSEPPGKPWFCVRIRELRVASRRTQREVAESIGVKESTYANAEASRHRRLRLERVRDLATLYDLDRAAADALVAGWEAMPESEYNQRNAKSWAKRDERRSKLKGYDLLKLSLLELATLLVTSIDDPGGLCACSFGASEADDRCELCSALQLLGLSAGWTTRDEVVSGLAIAQDKLTTGKAPP